jgi:hypothetical protein
LSVALDAVEQVAFKSLKSVGLLGGATLYR